MRREENFSPRPLPPETALKQSVFKAIQTLHVLCCRHMAPSNRSASVTGQRCCCRPCFNAQSPEPQRDWLDSVLHQDPFQAGVPTKKCVPISGVACPKPGGGWFSYPNGASPKAPGHLLMSAVLRPAAPGHQLLRGVGRKLHRPVPQGPGLPRLPRDAAGSPPPF